MIPDERKGGQRITRVRRASLALLLVGIALWAASLVFSASHPTLAPGASDGTVRLWHAAPASPR